MIVSGMAVARAVLENSFRGAISKLVNGKGLNSWPRVDYLLKINKPRSKIVRIKILVLKPVAH